MVGRVALLIVGGSRSRAALGFIAGLIIIRDCGYGNSAPSLRGGAPPPHNLSPRQPRYEHGRPPLRGKSRGFSTQNWSRKIAALAHSRVVSSARAVPDQAALAANPAESQTRFPDSPAMPRPPRLPAGSTCSK